MSTIYVIRQRCKYIYIVNCERDTQHYGKFEGTKIYEVKRNGASHHLFSSLVWGWVPLSQFTMYICAHLTIYTWIFLPHFGLPWIFWHPQNYHGVECPFHNLQCIYLHLRLMMLYYRIKQIPYFFPQMNKLTNLWICMIFMFLLFEENDML